MVTLQDINQAYGPDGLNLELSLGPPTPSPPHESQRQPEPEPVAFSMVPLPPQMVIPHPFITSSRNISLSTTEISGPQTAISHSFTSSRNISRTPSIDRHSNNSSPTTPTDQRSNTSSQMAPTDQEHSNNPRSSNPRRRRKKQNDASIEPPYPWSTVKRGVICSLEYLQSNNILTITGDVRCKHCDEKYTMEYDLVEKFNEIARFIARSRDTLHDRAPSSWITPVLPNCEKCGQENCVEPVIPDEENNFSKINWLFLLLGQFLGRLKLKQLKYFCSYTSNHRTGAKNRLVYLTYLALCKQLQPSNRLFQLRC